MLREKADDLVPGDEVTTPVVPQRPGFRIVGEVDVLAATTTPYILVGDARHVPLANSTVDLIVTSPPYFNKRDYDVAGQIGRENTPSGYVDSMMDCLQEWRRVLRPGEPRVSGDGDAKFFGEGLESQVVPAAWRLVSCATRRRTA